MSQASETPVLLNVSNKPRFLEEFKDVFALFDHDSSGKIDASELHKTLTQLGFRYTLADCDKLVGKIDQDGDGEVDMREFLDFCSQSMARNPIEWERDIETAFHFLDLDGNGVIEFQEFYDMLHKLGIEISRDELEIIFKEVDVNGDGQVDLSELKMMMAQKPVAPEPGA